MAEKILRKADVAQVLGVSLAKAAELMKEMRCINLSRNQQSQRPRWGVTESELTRWQKERAQVPSERRVMKPETKRRRMPAPSAYDPRYFEPDGRIKKKRVAL